MKSIFTIRRVLELSKSQMLRPIRSQTRQVHHGFVSSASRPHPHFRLLQRPRIAIQTQTRGYRRPFQYQRFQQTQGYLLRWAARPTFLYEVGGIAALCGGFYVYNLEPVPVSGRQRFNLLTPSLEATIGQEAYQETMQQYRGQILSNTSREHRIVQRVLDRLIPFSGLPGSTWEVHVINDPQANAFVVPGGKVFVFRGMLSLCQYDEDSLAAVLSHEIAHNVAHHTAERLSRGAMIVPLAWIASKLTGLDIGLGGIVAHYAFTLPGSRAQEAEADYIGLLMMAQACFDPEAAMGLWARLEELDEDAPPQWLSTHPSHHNRLEKIRGWLPEARGKGDEGGCGGVLRQASDFKRLVGFNRL